MSKSEEIFLAIKDRYLIAYKKNNPTKTVDVFYKNGFVYIKSVLNTSKVRISKFEEMCNTLENRLK